MSPNETDVPMNVSLVPDSAEFVPINGHSKNLDLAVKVSPEMRTCARDLVLSYDSLRARGMSAKMIAPRLERSQEYRDLVAAVREANPHLDPNRVGDKWMLFDLQKASDGPLNSLLAEEAGNLGLKPVPALFEAKIPTR